MPLFRPSETDNDLVEEGRANLLMALACFDRVGLDQAGVFKHLHLGRDS